MLDCDSFAEGSRKRAICDGTIDMPLSKINSYRQKWGWEPLDIKPETTYVVQDKPIVRVCKSDGTSRPNVDHSRPDTSYSEPVCKQPGTRLKEEFAKWNAESCPICDGLAAQMNMLGASGCKQNIDKFVADILERGKVWFEKNFPVANSLFKMSRSTKVRDIGLRLQIKSMVTRAILDTEKEEAEQLKKKVSNPRNQKRKVDAVAGVDFRISFRRKAQIRKENVAKQNSIIWMPGDQETTTAGLLNRQKICQSCPLYDGRKCLLSPNCELKDRIKAANAFCPVGKWSKESGIYNPLDKPVRNLVWHIWPKLGKEWNWHKHIELIRLASPLFGGKIVIGINQGSGLARPEEVMRLFDGVPVTDWIVRDGSSKLGETTTFVDSLDCLEKDDKSHITFRGHCKGVSHKQDGIEQTWSRLMWATCMDIPSVEQALQWHIMAGPLKCQEPLVSHQRYRWFYAGTFFWFRNYEIFQRDWREMEQTRWYPEAWPGVLCKNDEAACLCHDFTDGSVLRENYWNDVVRPSFEEWKSARPNRDRRFE